MLAIRSLARGACCLSAALAYHVVPEANLTAAARIASEVHNLTAQGPPTGAQHQQVPQQQHGPQPHAPPGAANASANLSAASPSANSSGSAPLTPPQGNQSSLPPEKSPHPSAHQPHQPAVASAPKVTEATSSKLAHQVRDATNAMAAAEGRLERATAATKKASQIYDDARNAELVAKKVQEGALKAVRAAKDRRAAYYKEAKAESGGSSPKVQEADEAIRKAQRNFDMARAKWQRAKEEAPKKTEAIREASAGVKAAEASKAEAAKAAKVVEVAMREQKHKDELAKQEVQHLKEKQAKLREQKAEKVAEYKAARKERLEKKDGATPKGVELMKAHERHLAESVHDLDSKAKEARQELKAHKANGKTSVHSAAKL